MTTNQPSNDQSHSIAEGHLPATGDQSLTNKPNELQTRPIASFQSINIFELETFKFQQINAECQRRTLPLPSKPTKALLVEILLTDNLKQHSAIDPNTVDSTQSTSLVSDNSTTIDNLTTTANSLTTDNSTTVVLPTDMATLLQTVNQAMTTMTELTRQFCNTNTTPLAVTVRNQNIPNIAEVIPIFNGFDNENAAKWINTVERIASINSINQIQSYPIRSLWCQKNNR